MVPLQPLTPSAAYDCPAELCPGTSDRKSAPMDISTRLRLTRLTFDFEHHLLLLLLSSATRLQLVSLLYEVILVDWCTLFILHTCTSFYSIPCI